MNKGFVKNKEKPYFQDSKKHECIHSLLPRLLTSMPAELAVGEKEELF